MNTSRLLIILLLLSGSPGAHGEDSAASQPYDYVGIASAYADFMLEHGRDTYGPQHTPLFITGMDRETGRMIKPPFAHVKRKPFMPGWERDRELRPSDRNYGQADPLDHLTLLKLMHRLSEVTGDKRYGAEADTTAAWWMANAQSPIGLYPWGTHTYWDVNKESGSGAFEFNHIWPYWQLNPAALQTYAIGLWDHYIYDKETGNFNRHAHSHKHGPGGGMEFPWPGSAMIATWVEAYLDNPDPEYVRAISTVLGRWESLRDENDHLAPSSRYGEWAWYLGYMIAANRLDDWAERIEAKEPELAERMRDYGRRNDAAYLKVSDKLLDVKGVGPVKSYLRATGDYDPERLDTIGGPWQDRKDYADFAVLLHERMKRNDSPALQTRYRQAILDTAEVYMSINPEVQWAVWGANMANAMELMLTAHELTGNVAYLHRADHFGRLAVDLFLDEVSPLPKLTSHDDYYEIESVTPPSGDVWMLVALDLQERLSQLDPAARKPHTANSSGVRDASGVRVWDVWDCRKLSQPVASVRVPYGEGGERHLFLSRREAPFISDNGLPVDGLEMIASDHVNSLPTLEEVKPFNGVYRRKFSGKYREPSTAQYGGFKDVLDRAQLFLVNHGNQAANVTVSVTLHDSWDDRESKDYTVTIEPGGQAVVACDSPAKRFIRRFDFESDVADAVTLEQFAFAMTPRSKLNPLTDERGPAFGDATPRLVEEGLVVHLSAEQLSGLTEGSPVDAWPNSANPRLRATAEGNRRPIFVREGGRGAVRFDGSHSYLSIPDDDALDLQAWTLIVRARAKGGRGVILSKTDEHNLMANYRLQVDSGESVSSMVRGSSADHNVNRQAMANMLDRFALMAARFDPKAKGTQQITIQVDGHPGIYSYEDARGDLSAITHERPLEIGRQPLDEPRYFKGDISDILLYDRALTDEELNATARWLYESKEVQQTANAKSTEEVHYTSSADHSKQPAIVFLIAGQSNAGGVAAFSPETNAEAGMATKHPTLPGSTAKEIGIPAHAEAYPRSYIWVNGFEPLQPGKNLKGGYRDPWRHGIELPMAMLLEKRYPDADKYFVKHGPAGHNLHTQWRARTGPDYKAFMNQFEGAMAELNKRYQKVRVIGLYWDQGESDQSEAAEYGDNLRAVFAALRKDTDLPDLPIFVRKHLFQHDKPAFAPIIEAQIAVSKTEPHTHLLDLDLGSNEKNFKAWAWTDNNGHLSSKAYLELAKRIIETPAWFSGLTP